ncbi:DinB family protein [Streptomyces sp. CBMA123]|uniref:DinB family protein n=1 Tax=Streptomyces sp. CBMA123 TaxID=1896313 RepID=UPI0016618D98|nr:DinB family protein [Streptomyces sp. CBMA123]MBD0696070.1 Mini-circle protein [Streptomyces sp. CBMA123]
MRSVVPEPSPQLSDPQELLLGYLDFLRSTVAAKITGMTESDLRTSRLPSGWSPLELIKHLVYMERRWLRWGFLGEPVPEPHGDKDASGRWHVGPEETVTELLAALYAGGERTRAIVTGAALKADSSAGGRFTGDAHEQRPSLGWILSHVLQEYARHAGHLDIARELADGVVGK